MSDYSDIFGREPEPWREPLGALRLTLADEILSPWQIDRARAECEALVRVLNEHPPADQGKPQDEYVRGGVCLLCGGGVLNSGEHIDPDRHQTEVDRITQGKPQPTEGEPTDWQKVAAARAIFEGYVGRSDGFDKAAFAYDREFAEHVAERALRAAARVADQEGERA